MKLSPQTFFDPAGSTSSAGSAFGGGFQDAFVFLRSAPALIFSRLAAGGASAILARRHQPVRGRQIGRGDYLHSNRWARISMVILSAIISWGISKYFQYFPL
jgi:hypothetical protein